MFGDNRFYLWQVKDLTDFLFDDLTVREVLGAAPIALRTVDHDVIGVLDWFETVSLVTELFARAATRGRAIRGDGGLANPSAEGGIEEFFELRPSRISNSATRAKRTATVACNCAISATFSSRILLRRSTWSLLLPMKSGPSVSLRPQQNAPNENSSVGSQREG